MTTKTFVDFQEPVVDAAWLNDVDELTYQGSIATGGTARRTLPNHFADILNVKDFGAVGDGVTDDTAAIVAAMAAATEGSTILFPSSANHYLFTQLTITKTLWFLGQGWHNSVQAAYGNSGYLSSANVSGSILRSTYTGAGSAITCTTLGKGPRFSSMALIGPGSGSATAITFGSTAAYQVLGRWEDFFIANFPVGVVLTNVEDWTFDTVRLRAISAAAWTLQSGNTSPNTNQNVFLNPEIQYCATGILITEAANNVFIGGLLQNVTDPVKIAPSANGRVAAISFWKIWFEANTRNCALDLTNGGIQHLEFNGTYHNGASAFFTLTNPANQTVTWLTMNNVTAAGLALSLAPGASVGPAFARVSGNGSRFASIDVSNATSNTDLMTLTGSAVYDPPNLADGAGTTTTVTVTGAALGDFSQVSFSLDLQGITVTSWVSAANTVSVRFQNESGGALDLASGTLSAKVVKA